MTKCDCDYCIILRVPHPKTHTNSDAVTYPTYELCLDCGHKRPIESVEYKNTKTAELLGQNSRGGIE